MTYEGGNSMDYVLDQKCGGCTIENKNCAWCVQNMREGMKHRRKRARAYSEEFIDTDSPIDAIPD